MTRNWEILIDGKVHRSELSFRKCAKLCRWHMSDPRVVIRRRLKKKHRKQLV